MSHFYDRAGEPITLTRWNGLIEDLDYRRVDRTSAQGVVVSTVWLGIDHNLDPAGPPLFFETMTFGGPLDGEIVRYSSELDAREGHARAVRRAGLA